MKHKLQLIAVMALAFLAASCQRENLEPVAGGSTVTYTVQIPDAIATKAIGDGHSRVTKLIYEVYREAQLADLNAAPIYEGEAEINDQGVAALELEFVKNQKFTVLFWAQNPDVDVYTTDDLRNVQLAQTLTSNNVNTAVFAGSDKVDNCVSAANGDVDLVRPIAQLRIGTTPESLVIRSTTTVTLKKSDLKVKGLSTTYNVATKAVGADKSEFTYSEADVPAETFKANNVDYQYVAMSYVGFASDLGANIDVEFNINTSEGVISHEVVNVPVKPNYRTNIVGNLITASADYNVSIEDNWETTEHNVKVVTVSDAQGLQAAIDNSEPGTETNVKLEGDIDLGALAGLISTKADETPATPTYGLLIPAGKALVLDLNGCTLSQTVEQTAGYSMILNNGTLTIDDSKGNGKISYTDSGNGGEYISDAIYNKSVLVINGGTIENLSSATVASNGYPHAVDTYSGIGNTSVTINGGTIYCAEYSAVRMFCVSATNAADLVINGGTIKGAIDMQNGTTVAAVGTLTINDGTFQTTKNANNIRFANWNSGATEYGLTASIKGGLFNGGIQAKYVPEAANWNKGIITGGTFTVDPSDYVANGYVAKQNENNQWTIVPAPAVVEGGYEISNAAQLKYFAESVNAGETTYNGTTIKLAADIDLQNEPWTPIGFNSNSVAGSEKYFTGTFDGQNHTIRNLKIDVKDQGGVGLFGTVYNASFKNFTLENVDIKAVESEDDPANTSGAENHSNYIVGGHTGAVVGYDAKAGEVNFENVHVKGLVRIEGETRASQGQRIGGIIGGRGSSKMTFKNVSVKGIDGSYIKGYCSTAGVSGQIQNVATYENVHTDIDVYAVTFGAGGIAGIVRQGSTFTNCSSAGDITLDASKTQLSSYSANYPYRVGGMAGCWSESATGVLTLTDCTYTGNLTSIDRDGNTPQTLDYAGYVGRGYTLNGCAGSKVVIDGVEYVQAYNTAAEAGIYIVDGVLEIASAAALRTLATNVNNGKTFEGQTVRLADDIDLNNEEWIPIGSATADHGFMGNFDGNGKTISNLQMTELTTDSDNYVYAGLFGVTEGTESQENYIKNLVIENVTIETTGHIAAAAIAYPYYTTVENITVKGNINITGGDYTSGVLAYTRRCVNAKNLAVEGNTGSSITGNTTVGGVISDIQMNGGLTANYSNFKASGLTITAVKSVGGISGIISGQTLDGATVEDLVIACDSNHKGSVSGSLGSKSLIKNISVKNVQGADSVVGAPYDGTGKVAVNGDEYSITVE